MSHGSGFARLIVVVLLVGSASPPPAAAQASCGNVVASTSLDGCSVPGPPDWSFNCSGGASAYSVTDLNSNNCWLVLQASASMDQRCEASHIEDQLATAAAYDFEARLKVTDLAPQCSCQEGPCGCMVTTFRASDGDRMPMLNLSIQPGDSGFVTFFDSSAPYGWLTFLVDIAAVHTYRVEVERGGQARLLVDGVVLHSTAYANLPAAAYVPPGLEWFIDQWATVWIDRVSFDVCGPSQPPSAPRILSPQNGLATNVPPSTVTGEAESGTTVLLFDSGVLLASGPASGGTFAISLPAPLADGFHVLTARAQRGNQVSLASQPVAVTVDTTPPPAPVIEAPVSGVLESALLYVGGSAEAGADVTVAVSPGGTTTTTADGAGRFLGALSNPITAGQIHLTARATDAAGNQSPLSAPVVVTVAAPTAAAPKVSPRGAIELHEFSASPPVYVPGGPPQLMTANLVVELPKTFRQSENSNHRYTLKIVFNIVDATGKILNVLTTHQPLDPKAGPLTFAGATAWTGKTADQVGVAPGAYSVVAQVSVIQERKSIPLGLKIPPESFATPMPTCATGNRLSAPRCAVDTMGFIGNVAVAPVPVPPMGGRYTKRSYANAPPIFPNVIKIKFADSSRILASQVANAFVTQINRTGNVALPPGVQATLDGANSLITAHDLRVAPIHRVDATMLWRWKSSGEAITGHALPYLATWSGVRVGRVPKSAAEMTDADRAELAAVIDAFNALPLVEVAYPPGPSSTAAIARYPDTCSDSDGAALHVGPKDDPGQLNLWRPSKRTDPSKYGIDVKYARDFLGGAGTHGELAEVVVVDKDENFHEDIPQYEILLGRDDGCYSVDEPDYQVRHSLGSIGVVFASENLSQPYPYGVEGIAPRAGVGFASYKCGVWGDFYGFGGRADTVDQAVSTATSRLDPGGIILIEQQVWDWDMWWLLYDTSSQGAASLDDSTYDAIKTAVANRMVVVEAAGNYDFDLDVLTNTSVDHDTGSLIVGAYYPETYVRSTWLHGQRSNYGRRVNVYAWGDEVWSPYNGEPDASQNYGWFAGTSSASSIVAGAAALLQSVYKTHYNPTMPLDSASLRDILSTTAIPVEEAYYPGGAIDLRPAIDGLDTIVWDFNEVVRLISDHTLDDVLYYSRPPYKRALSWSWCRRNPALCPGLTDDLASPVSGGGRAVNLPGPPAYAAYVPGFAPAGTVGNLEFPGDLTVEAVLWQTQKPTQNDAIIVGQTSGAFRVGLAAGTGELFYDYFAGDIVEQQPASLCRVNSGFVLPEGFIAVVHDTGTNQVKFYSEKLGSLLWTSKLACGVRAASADDLVVGAGIDATLDHLLLRSRVSNLSQVMYDQKNWANTP
ncbi:MAG: S8 family serine peptidase [Deltaproteobacteria bacterium]|nr:S8 family serine peptidase [Deltaproteobacteria bacterium]